MTGKTTKKKKGYLSRTASETSSTVSSTPVPSKNGKLEHPPVVPETNEESPAPVKQMKSKDPIPDTKTYTFTNVIDEKKKTGVYSKWRSNAVENPCLCGNEECICNINPAIIGIERRDSEVTEELEDMIESDQETVIQPPITDENPVLDKKIIEEDRTVQNETKVAADHQETQSTATLSEVDFVKKKIDRRSRTLSIMMACTCSASSCDCMTQREYLTKSLPPEQPDWEVPSRPPVTPNWKRRSSLEIHKKTLSKSKVLDETEVSAHRNGDEHGATELHLDPSHIRSSLEIYRRKSSVKSKNSVSEMDHCEVLALNKNPTNRRNDYGHGIKVHLDPSRIRSSLEVHRRKSSGKQKNCHPETDNCEILVLNKNPSNKINEPKEARSLPDKKLENGCNARNLPRSSSMSKSRKSISLMVKNCCCSAEDCDCFDIEQVQRLPSKMMDWEKPKVQTHAPAQKVDSVDLLRKRISEHWTTSMHVIYPASTFDDTVSTEFSADEKSDSIKGQEE
ncbi:hypothetical protein JTB14_006270 [Gonioctena quinquepunctata]|nr:hypothetical protein JTB14_006270 [Gonioctena quinquepunctata]